MIHTSVRNLTTDFKEGGSLVTLKFVIPHVLNADQKKIDVDL